MASIQTINDPGSALNGAKIAVVPPSDAMWGNDPGGTHGSLRYQYATIALIFQSTGGVWIPQRTSLTIGQSGNTDTDTSTGFTDKLTLNETSFWKNGFPSQSAWFCVKGIGFAPGAVAYSSALASSGANTANVATTGTTRNDCAGIVGELIQAYLASASINAQQQSNQCSNLLGLAAQMPAGFGLGSLADTTNGLLNCGNTIDLRRAMIFQPGSTNTPQYVFILDTSRALSVAADPSFAAPADNQVAVVKCLFHENGYYCTSDGTPLALDSGSAQDHVEAAIAHSVKDSY